MSPNQYNVTAPMNCHSSSYRLSPEEASEVRRQNAERGTQHLVDLRNQIGSDRAEPIAGTMRKITAGGHSFVKRKKKKES